MSDKITNTKSDFYTILDKLLKDAYPHKKSQILEGKSMIYKLKMAKMNFILYLSKKLNNFMKLACYVDYKGYEAYETRDEWGKATAKKGIPRDKEDAKEKAFMAAKVINNAIQKGFLTEKDIKDSGFEYILHRIKVIEPKLADWSAAVATSIKGNKVNSIKNSVNSTVR